MYHYVRDAGKTPFPGIKALSIADFERQLDLLAEGHDIIDYPRFLSWRAGEWEGKRPLALLTFDDGVVDHAETVLPILQRRGISGVFFLCGLALRENPKLLAVHAIHFLLARLGGEALCAAVESALAERGETPPPSAPPEEGTYRYDAGSDASIKRLLNYELPYDTVDAVLSHLVAQHLGDPAAFARELYLSAAMIRAMIAAGMTFGWHTQRHRILSRLTPLEQEAELLGGVAAIRSLTGQKCVPFSYPFGHRQTYNVCTLDLLRREGYAGAFTTTRAKVERTSALHELPRMDTKDLSPFTLSFPA